VIAPVFFAENDFTRLESLKGGLNGTKLVPTHFLGARNDISERTRTLLCYPFKDEVVHDIIVSIFMICYRVHGLG
jgi:hypothetical protein